MAWFDVASCLVVIVIATRRSGLFSFPTRPTLDWVIQQFLAIAECGGGPLYRVHYNDGSFGQFRERQAG